MCMTRRSVRRFCTFGSARALVVIAGLVTMGALWGATPAYADQHKNHLSRDLEAVLATVAAAPAEGIDVIVSGNPALIARLATKHRVSTKRALKFGAVFTLTRAQLATMAEDLEAGALSSDQTVRSDMALVTQATGAAAAWHGDIAKLGKVTGKGIGVAIIDSGVDNHTALAGRLIVSVDFTRKRTRAARAADEYGHGTHVAGIVVAGLPKKDNGLAPVGMAPGAHIVSLKVLDETGAGKASDVTEAIDWAIDHKDQYAIRIINLSLGAPPTQSWRYDPVCQAVERAVRAGIVVVVSAGNNGQTLDGAKQVFGSITSPGNSPYAVTVGALRTNGTADRSDDYVAPWSSKGPTYIDHVIKPDLVAPGSRVVSLLAPGSTLARENPERIVFGEGRNGYFELTGTSMAAAVVSGAAALILQSQPQLNPLQVKLVLQAATDFLPSAGLIGGGAGSITLDRITDPAFGQWRPTLAQVFPTSLNSQLPPSQPHAADGIYWGDEGIYWGNDGIYWGNEGIYWGDDGIYWGNEGIYWGNEGIYWGDDGIYWGNEGIYWGNEGIYWGNEGIYWGNDGIYWGNDGIYWGNRAPLNQ